jgi:hypothetical protein
MPQHLLLGQLPGIQDDAGRVAAGRVIGENRITQDVNIHDHPLAAPAVF